MVVGNGLGQTSSVLEISSIVNEQRNFEANLSLHDYAW